MLCVRECTWSGGCTWSRGAVPGWGVYLVGGVPGLEGGTWPRGTWPGGVPGPRGVYLVPGGCTWSQGGVPGLGGVPGPREVYLVLGGGVPGWSQGGVPGQVLPPLWTESQTPVKT